MKKQMILALVLLLLIPVVVMAGGFLASLINPEIAARHANYARNFHLLMLAKAILFLGGVAIAGILWLLVCFLVIRSKERSLWWLGCAVLGPLGFAVLAVLDDRAPLEGDRYARFVRSLNRFVRAGYEALTFFAIWWIAYELMVALRNLLILSQSVMTGVSTAETIAQQNASSGMWAFTEGNEVMFMVALFYLLRPFAFNAVGRMTRTSVPAKAGR